MATVLAALLSLALTAAPALASHSQTAIIQDDGAVFSNPGATLQEMRHIGAQMVRLTVRWSAIAPAATSRRRPNFNATDPNAYPSGNWAPFDTIVRDAHADGLKLLFTVTAAAPYWGQGANPGRYRAHYSVEQAFEPSASAFGQFVRAVGTRYSGSFKPPGSLTALPRVSDWELYNEANFGEDLAPQAIDHSAVLWAPVMLRPLLNAAWGALRASGHGSDTKLIGALAARGSHIVSRRAAGLPGTYGETPPLAFIRDLYCVDGKYHPFRGAAAGVRSCPTTAAASRRFRAQNPALFSATGFSIHPYQLTADANAPPDITRYHNPDYVSLSQLPRLASTLDRVQRVYRSGKRFSLWNDEWGYITDPPVAVAPATGCRCHFVSPSTAATYMNWAEYMEWSNPRVASSSQFLLYDPNPSVGVVQYGGFASGLIYYPTVLGGQPKPSYFAYRLPIFMPKTATRLGNTLQVWGDVRPAPYAVADGDGAQFVQVEFQSSSGGQWISEKTVQVTDPHGYFQTSVAFPGSGLVRIAWTYPPSDLRLASNLVTPTQTVGPNGYFEPLTPTTSRTVAITLR
ncbi:MAG TPA: hypothetical protein VMP89_02415 [Solirubrobacteraceae bacterium]|nr:hypothetical protein [Solirubrobacteraceae bacterium]